MKKLKTIDELLKECSKEIQENLELLFDKFKTLENILANEQANLYYHEFMIHVVVRMEINRNFVEYDYMRNYKLTRSFKEIKKDYGGTVLLPCL